MKPFAGFSLFLLYSAAVSAVSAQPSAWIVRTIGNPAQAGSSVPRLATSSDGLVYLSWVEPFEGGAAFRFAVWSGGKWSNSQTVSRGPEILAATSSEPGVIPLGNRMLGAQWLTKAKEKDANHIAVAVSRDLGIHWSAPVQPYRDGTPGEHMYVSLFSGGDGGMGVVWLDPRRGELTELVQTTVDATGKLGSEHVIKDDVCGCCPTSTAATARGPVLMYRNRTEADVRDMYLSSLKDGRFESGHAIHMDNWTVHGCPTNAGAITASGDKVAAVWFTGADGAKRVKFAFSGDDGATFQKAAIIDGDKPVGRASAALLKDGSAVVVWIGGNNSLLARQVWADGRLGSVISIVSAGPEGKLGFPFAAAAGDGVMAVWTDWKHDKALGVRTALLLHSPVK